MGDRISIAPGVVAQLGEHNAGSVEVAGSIPADSISGAIAQLGERLFCKQEVVGSIPTGSILFVKMAHYK